MFECQWWSESVVKNENKKGGVMQRYSSYVDQVFLSILIFQWNNSLQFRILQYFI